MIKRLALLATLALGLAATLSADPIIDFGTGSAGPGGTISFTGNGNPIVGTNILIGVVTSLNTPLNGGNAYTANALLNFTTGAATWNGTNGYSYLGGGSISIVGTANIPGLTTGSNALIASGSFAPGSFTNTGTFAFVGSGTDVKDRTLVAFFGLQNLPFNFLGFSIASTSGGINSTTGAFTSTAFSTDISNTATPEPAAVIVFGTMLMGAGLYLRKRFV